LAVNILGFDKHAHRIHICLDIIQLPFCIGQCVTQCHPVLASSGSSLPLTELLLMSPSDLACEVLNFLARPFCFVLKASDLFLSAPAA